MFIRARIIEEIDQAINRQSKCANIDTLKESGGGITNKQDVPNTMNAYFCSAGNDLARVIEALLNPMVTGKYNLNS